MYICIYNIYNVRIYVVKKIYNVPSRLSPIRDSVIGLMNHTSRVQVHELL